MCVLIIIYYLPKYFLNLLEDVPDCERCVFDSSWEQIQETRKKGIPNQINMDGVVQHKIMPFGPQCLS